MKEVLYITNQEVPYKSRLFNVIAQDVDLTVLYQSRDIGARDSQWARSIAQEHKVLFARERGGNWLAIAFVILKVIFSRKWDAIVIGCINEKPQYAVLLLLKMLRKSYMLNMDGEYFFCDNSLKSRVKRFFIRGAKAYLVAGEKATKSLRKIGISKPVYPYNFTSLTKEEVIKNSSESVQREDFVLVVGQYFDYKGMDIALNMALLNKNIRYKFIGMGKRQNLFQSRYDCTQATNVEFIPFLQKPDLEREFRRCAAFVLPSRQECWGLVVNEAASFGTPIVSTWGSGAAVEFLSDKYPQFLATPGDVKSLYEAMMDCLQRDNTEYSSFLKETSLRFTIERCASAHIEAFTRQ